MNATSVFIEHVSRKQRCETIFAGVQFSQKKKKTKKFESRVRENAERVNLCNDKIDLFYRFSCMRPETEQ